MNAIMRERLIRDPVHGYVRIPTSLLRVVDDPLVQRLRRIAQNSLATAVYPTMSGSRFEHSLGAMHLARLAWDSAWRNATPDTREKFSQAVALEVPEAPDDQGEFRAFISDAVGCVGLLHDIGHPPFSHALEPLISSIVEQAINGDDSEQTQQLLLREPQEHEIAGWVITRQIVHRALSGALKEAVLRIYETSELQPSWAGCLHGLVAGELDVDRLDYLLRDAQRAGTEFGAIDCLRLVDNFELKCRFTEWRMGLRPHALSAAETLLFQRLQSYRWMLFHPWVVASNLFLLRGLQILIDLTSSQTKITQEAGGEERSSIRVGDLFEEVRSDLNYLTPSEPDFGSIFDGSAGNSIPDLADYFTGTTAASPAWGIRRQASLDDAAVLEWLKRGTLRAHFLASHGKIQGDEAQLAKKLIAYYDAVIFRRKAFIPVWKNWAEYATISKCLTSDEFPINLQLLTKRVFEELQRELEGASPAAREFHEILRRRAEGHINQGDWTGLLNFVSEYAIQNNECAVGNALGLQASSILDDSIPGFWELKFVDFRALKQEESGAVFFDGDETVSLTAASPLARALNTASEGRIKLFAFFVTLAENDLDGFDQRREVIKELQKSFVEYFPLAIAGYYRGALLKEIQWKADDH
ncbi:HD domain-containing protein [Streptomyces sp. Ag109_G2-6]|uniref:HD domain-containing protein n=1 Tax=Streptomyces TaxID=1883 RepID=UPI000D1B57C6|nr:MULTISPECIES: HD domain-containing protein [Streptomyces]RPF40742.1 HD domain-containing protein [Streptomyces sp. Ag109_G2-6]